MIVESKIGDDDCMTFVVEGKVLVAVDMGGRPRD